MKPYGDCIYCGGEVIERLDRVDYRLKEDLFILERVPTGICTQCGEKYFRAEVVKQMEDAVLNPTEMVGSVTVPIIEVG